MKLTDGLAAKTSAKAGKTSSYSEYCPCPANLPQFWMKMAIPSSATATMRGVRRCGVPVSWRKRWARCRRSAIVGMCLTRKRGCTICGAGTIILNWVDFMVLIEYTKEICLHIAAIKFWILWIDMGKCYMDYWWNWYFSFICSDSRCWRRLVLLLLGCSRE